MSSDRIKIGTRASSLARIQAGLVQERLSVLGIDSELVFVSTPGDRSLSPIEEIGVGVFTSSLRDALLRKEIDVAVHSYKDLPTAAIDNLAIAAIPERVDPRDALIARNGLVLSLLPSGSTVGTSALRRTSQITALGLGLEIRPLRGNLDSRLQKVSDGELDAVVVARAGLLRLGQADKATEVFDPLHIMPAPAQGALGIECRSDDELREVLEKLDHLPSRIAVTAERAVLAKLEAGCTAPVGATAEIVESLDDDGKVIEELFIRAVVCAPDGSDIIRASITGSPTRAALLGEELAAELLDCGAADFFGTTL